MSIEKLRVRMLNGYRVIYLPEHPKAMTTKNWEGFVYEHIVVAEKKMKRPLNQNEVVHHLDNNPANNRNDNLIVLTREVHSQLHGWINKILPLIQNSEFYINRNDNYKFKELESCKICNNILQKGQESFCSAECMYKYRGLEEESKRGKSKPSKEQLQEDMNTLPWTHIGEKYGVSNNAAKKWAAAYGLETKKERIVIKTNPSPKKIYNTPEEKQKAKNERNRLKRKLAKIKTP